MSGYIVKVGSLDIPVNRADLNEFEERGYIAKGSQIIEFDVDNLTRRELAILYLYANISLGFDNLSKAEMQVLSTSAFAEEGRKIYEKARI